jgi:hypothetical protein
LKLTLLFTAILVTSFAKAQKIDSIYFHLYTDSLKKGVHNYINVDGKLSDGRWLPLTSKEIQFSSSGGKFEGNDLVLPADFAEEKITIKAALKTNSFTSKEITIWIKKKPDDEILPAKNDVFNTKPAKSRKRRNQ